MKPLSIREIHEGRHILVAGGSGFLGKVWLAMVLQRIPDIGRLYVLMRGKGRDPRVRFEKMLTESYVFKTLHDALGESASEYISRRVEIIEGDVSAPDLALDPAIAQRLRGKLDLVVNFAGLVDFNPDIREAVSANIDGALYVADFVESCANARLVHVSTCYVAGHRDGLIEETLLDESPNGQPMVAKDELANARRIIGETAAENDSAEVEAKLHGEVIARIQSRGQDPTQKRVAGMVGRLKRKRLRGMMSKAGTDRALELGWPNTYTYTKALAESLLAERTELVHAVFRPAIVESAREYPFGGWNEGFNTSGPLVYIAQTWFHHVPAMPGNPLDVIPVDDVCKGLLVVGAALLENQHKPIYQCGTSDLNLFPIDRLVELSALGNRRYLRKHGANALERLVMSRWDTTAADPEHMLNLGNIRALLKQLARYLRHGRPDKLPSEVLEASDSLADASDTANRKLRQIEDVLDLFQPFIHDHYLVLRCRAIQSHTVVEPEFRFAPEELDWRRYWIDTHMPGLRRWCFPQFENTEREIFAPQFPFKLISTPEPAATDQPREDVG
ncbi:MAG: SDR family oxidoreductase [Nannocystaceae bacterium]|nr:SDR family oxidoreductase [Nannocystaceae bacterium]